MQFRPIILSLALCVLVVAASVSIAQDGPKTTTLSELKNSAPPATPTAAEVMRERISVAKAYLVVKNYPAAVYELENIRRDTNEPTVNRVLNVLLMHAYLEQGDYKKAQSFLKELHKSPAQALDYFAVAGQVISGARTQLARYKALGVSVKDVTLPEEAKNDLDNMRETLEMVVTQSKDIGKRKDLAATAAAVLEESSSARGNLARDAYDEKHWLDQVADAREQIVTPRSNIINAVESPVVLRNQTPDVTLVAQRVEKEPVPVEKPKQEDTPKSDPRAAELKPVVDQDNNAVTDDESTGAEDSEEPVGEVPDKSDSKKVQPLDRKVRIIGSTEKKPTDEPLPKEEQPNVKSTDQVNKGPVVNTVASKGDDDSPLPIGSLIGYATRQVKPVYPRQARTMRMQGTVKVEVIVDENGKVTKVENTSGPALLKRAASDAIRKWEFRPFLVDGQPVKATGFVSFNFNL